MVFTATYELKYPKPKPYQNREEQKIYWDDLNQKNNKDHHRFAEANPNIPENLPDQTPLVSTKNQQAAQPLIDDKISNSILPEKRGDSTNLKVIQNKESDVSQPVDFPLPQSTEAMVTFTPSNYIPTQLDITAKSSDGEGIELKQNIGQSTNKIIKISDSGNAKFTEESKVITKQDHAIKKRPRLDQKLLNGPLLKSEAIAPRIGNLSIECRLNPLGIYMQEMLIAIERQWGALARNSFHFAKTESIPSKVTYQFTLLSNGQIEHLHQNEVKKSDCFASELCRQAIASHVHLLAFGAIK